MPDEDLINKNDLFEFIKKERKKPSLANIKKSYKLYNKYLAKSICELYQKLEDIKDINITQAITIGINLMFHIFWLIFSYTFNLKLTMFLSERSLLLYTEFIIMSRSPFLNRNLSFTPNINDAVIFSLKKTIGLLKTQSIKKKYQDYLNELRGRGQDIRNIMIRMLFTLVETNQDPTNEELSNTVEEIVQLLSNQLLQIPSHYNIRNVINSTCNMNVSAYNQAKWLYLLLTLIINSDKYKIPLNPSLTLFNENMKLKKYKYQLEDIYSIPFAKMKYLNKTKEYKELFKKFSEVNL